MFLPFSSPHISKEEGIFFGVRGLALAFAFSPFIRGGKPPRSIFIFPYKSNLSLKLA
jgi:hypothetical protein